MARNPAVSLAVAYAAFHMAETAESRRVWRDIWVDVADKLGLTDEDMHGLDEARADKRADEEAFMAAHRASLDPRRAA